jgi:predicted GNAT family acetyltransferase
MNAAGIRNESPVIDVRLSRSSDFIDLIRNEQTTIDPMSQHEMMAYLRERRHECCVAEIRYRIAGHVMWRIQRDHLIVDRLVVRDYYRKQGVGTELLWKALSRITNKIKSIHIPVRELDLSSQVWLRNRGLKCTRIASELQSYYLEDNTFWFEGRIQ